MAALTEPQHFIPAASREADWKRAGACEILYPVNKAASAVDQFARHASEFRQAAPPADSALAFAANTLGDLFWQSALHHPERPALWIDGNVVSYRALLAAAAPVAQALIAAGLGDGSQRCAVLGNRGFTDFVGLLGALLARCAYVPMHVRHPVSRLAQMIEQADLAAIVIGSGHADVARPLLEMAPRALSVILPDSEVAPEWAAGMARHRFLCRNDLPPAGFAAPPAGVPDDAAYLLFTSGTTGAPKGVLVRNSNVMPYLRSVAVRYAPTPQDRCTQMFDLTFDLSVHDLFLCWGAGAALYRVPDAARFAPREFVRRHSLTIWFSVPSAAATMLGLRMLRPGDFPSLRLALFCGEAFPKRLAEAWMDAAPNAVVENLYGPTEATIAMTAFRLPQDRRALEALPEVVPIGEAWDGQSAIVVDDADHPAPDDSPGELCLAGSQVTDGYWRRPDLTAQRFVRFEWDQRIWYRTGDLACHSRQHGLMFLGRIDRQVKIAGHRVELQEVEAVLHRAAGANAAAIAWPLDPDGLARGITGFVGADARPTAEILDACRLALPPYAVPTGLHRMDDWPRTSSGKTDHRWLQEFVEKQSCRKMPQS